MSVLLSDDVMKDVAVVQKRMWLRRTGKTRHAEGSVTVREQAFLRNVAPAKSITQSIITQLLD